MFVNVYQNGFEGPNLGVAPVKERKLDQQTRRSTKMKSEDPGGCSAMLELL